MISFQVADMSCGHCVATITQALKAVDGTATLRIDLAARRVDIEPHAADAASLSAAMAQAGYSPVRIAAPTVSSSPGAASVRKGSVVFQ